MCSLFTAVTANNIGDISEHFCCYFTGRHERNGKDSTAKPFLLAAFLLQITAISAKTAPDRA
jgi:hypothetical protein